MRILIAEDDAMIATSIRTSLQAEGYVVDLVRDGRAVGDMVASEHFDLLLLDLGLPGCSGLDILHALRDGRQDIPVIIITARDALDDKVKGLDLGADDYLVKPFNARELSARIRCAVRRSCGRAEPDIEIRDVRFNPDTRQLSKGGEAVILSARETAVVEALIQRPGRMLSRAQLEERIYGWGEEVDSNAVLVHIHQIRQKLGHDFIQTLRGVGYYIPKPDRKP
ncbi:MAG: response regulator [Burkholderiaceae bacterium]